MTGGISLDSSVDLGLWVRVHGGGKYGGLVWCWLLVSEVMGMGPWPQVQPP